MFLGQNTENSETETCVNFMTDSCLTIPEWEIDNLCMAVDYNPDDKNSIFIKFCEA